MPWGQGAHGPHQAVPEGESVVQHPSQGAEWQAMHLLLKDPS